jgi:hypothetical protein
MIQYMSCLESAAQIVHVRNQLALGNEHACPVRPRVCSACGRQSLYGPLWLRGRHLCFRDRSIFSDGSCIKEFTSSKLHVH